jgi:hypothetical protein
MEQKYPLFTGDVVVMVFLRIKNRNDDPCIEKVAKRIIEFLEKINFLENAPFTWMNFIYRYGENNIFSKPELKRINKKYGDLPVTVEIASDWIEYASFNDEPMLERVFEASALEALIYVGKKYDLPIESLEARLKEIGGFPELPEDYYEKLPPNPHRIPKGADAK